MVSLSKHLLDLLDKYQRMIEKKLNVLSQMAELEAAYNKTLIKMELDKMSD